MAQCTVTSYDLQMVRGDTLEFDVTIADAASLPTAAYMTVKAAMGQKAQLFQLAIGDGVTQSGSELHFRAAPELTFDASPGTYLYDVQIEFGNDVYTPLIGKLMILDDVTHIEGD